MHEVPVQHPLVLCRLGDLPHFLVLCDGLDDGRVLVQNSLGTAWVGRVGVSAASTSTSATSQATAASIALLSTDGKSGIPDPFFLFPSFRKKVKYVQGSSFNASTQIKVRRGRRHRYFTCR